MNFMKRGLQSLWAKERSKFAADCCFFGNFDFCFSRIDNPQCCFSRNRKRTKSVGATVTLQANRESLRQNSQTASSDTSEGGVDTARSRQFPEYTGKS